MNILPRKKIVLLGMMSHMPVAGVAWVTAQYLIGFQRLGYDVFYVEAHGLSPSKLMQQKTDDGFARAAAYIARVMGRFDLDDRWAYHAVHAGGRCYGMSREQLNQLYRDAALIINFHGGTVPLLEHSATGRLIYLETDPVEREISLHDNDRKSIELLEPHVAFFTWGLNYGNPSCQVPLPAQFHFRPSPPVVVPDLWEGEAPAEPVLFTTIGNWKQPGEVKYKGEVYTWTKHLEFLKFLDVPQRTGQAFELALSSFEEADRKLLEDHGWRVRRALDFSQNLDGYRDYLRNSRGEFTVAKDQNVRLRSGWFSERSAQYLACGRPVITQETGFSNVLPTGRGLFAFTTLDEIADAVAAINADYPRHSQAAAALAREWFSYDVVLPRMLSELGL